MSHPQSAESEGGYASDEIGSVAFQTPNGKSLVDYFIPGPCLFQYKFCSHGQESIPLSDQRPTILSITGACALPVITRAAEPVRKLSPSDVPPAAAHATNSIDRHLKLKYRSDR